MTMILLLATANVITALNLTLDWSYETVGTIYDLALSEDGRLVAVFGYGGGALIFDQHGNVIAKLTDGWFYDASYCCGMFALVNSWGPKVYVIDTNGNIMYTIPTGYDYDRAVAIVSNGVMACDDYCGFFDFNGTKLWDVKVGSVINSPSYNRGYWYVPDYGNDTVWIVKDGVIVNDITYNYTVYDAKACGNYLAVSTWQYLYLYDLSDPTKPTLLWELGGFDYAKKIAFSPDCRYIAVADKYNHMLKIVDTKTGDIVYSKWYGDQCCDDDVVAVAWNGNHLAVGLYNGRIEVYNVTEAPTAGYTYGYTPTYAPMPYLSSTVVTIPISTSTHVNTTTTATIYYDFLTTSFIPVYLYTNIPISTYAIQTVLITDSLIPVTVYLTYHTNVTVPVTYYLVNYTLYNSTTYYSTATFTTAITVPVDVPITTITTLSFNYQPQTPTTQLCKCTNTTVTSLITKVTTYISTITKNVTLTYNYTTTITTTKVINNTITVTTTITKVIPTTVVTTTVITTNYTTTILSTSITTSIQTITERVTTVKYVPAVSLLAILVSTIKKRRKRGQ